jgi:hypothetical protein
VACWYFLNGGISSATFQGDAVFAPMVLISCVIFGFLCCGLWALWRRYAPSIVAPGTQRWIRQPGFFLFLVVTLVLALFYRRGTKR